MPNIEESKFQDFFFYNSTASGELMNPMSTVAGLASISSQLRVTAEANFPSVTCRDYGVTSGKWYYEALLRSDGCMQVGWADNSFLPNTDLGQGVGTIYLLFTCQQKTEYLH